MGKPRIVELRPTHDVLDFPHPGRARVRRWEGETGEGVRVDVYVAAVRVRVEDLEEFEAVLGTELEELRPPTSFFYHLEPLPEGEP